MKNHPHSLEDELLEGLAHVRKRPAMYIGFLDQRAFHHLVYIALDEVAEKAVNGLCRHVTLILRDENEIVIQDESDGLRIDIHPKTGVSCAELIMTRLGYGIRRKIYGDNYLPTSIILSPDLACLNALSKQLTVEIKRDGYLWQQQYAEGVPQTILDRVRPLAENETTGTTITFTPDFSILESHSANYDTLARRCKELAHVLAGLELIIRDERNGSPREDKFFAPDGLYSLVKALNQNANPLHPIVHFKDCVMLPDEKDGQFMMQVEAAFQFTAADEVQQLSYANTVITPENGTHLKGLHAGILKFINRDARKYYKHELLMSSLLPGFTGIASFFHPKPQFYGRMRVEIINPEVFEVVKQATYQALVQQYPNSQDFTAPILDQYFARKR